MQSRNTGSQTGLHGPRKKKPELLTLVAIPYKNLEDLQESLFFVLLFIAQERKQYHSVFKAKRSFFHFFTPEKILILKFMQ